MKSVLVIGKTGYIAAHLTAWLTQDSMHYDVCAVSSRDEGWKSESPLRFDVVVNAAGLAHISHITEKMREQFFEANRDLPAKIGEWAKKKGAGQIIHISSMNVYGDDGDAIVDRDNVCPSSFYGKSKLQGELALRELEDEGFRVACVRPPFVYGKGCKGNYNRICSIAKKTPFFPDYPNRKSMIYIDNLCEFVRLLIDSGEGGVFTPQNLELVSTADLVREIATANGHSIWITKVFNWCVPIGKLFFGAARKAFADDYYSPELSDCFGWKYCVVGFEESIEKTEN